MDLDLPTLFLAPTYLCLTVTVQSTGFGQMYTHMTMMNSVTYVQDAIGQGTAFKMYVRKAKIYNPFGI